MCPGRRQNPRGRAQIHFPRRRLSAFIIGDWWSSTYSLYSISVVDTADAGTEGMKSLLLNYRLYNIIIKLLFVCVCCIMSHLNLMTLSTVFGRWRWGIQMLPKGPSSSSSMGVMSLTDQSPSLATDSWNTYRKSVSGMFRVTSIINVSFSTLNPSMHLNAYS